jgi:glyceraldehyde 3-phosphate dehydrogenase
LAEKDPEKLPWKDLGVDIVLECTGLFTDEAGAKKHITAGAKKVIVSAPCKDLPGFVLGVNAETYDSTKVDIMDMGSCTTNCLAPIAKVLNDEFGIEKGFMTTIHSYTNDQKILDLPHKDLRRARAAALNMIPTSTGAAKAIGKMIPELNGKLDGIAVRVPTPVVSLLDLIVEVKKSTTKGEVNEAFKKASESKNFKGILKIEEQPLVSMDFKGDTYSSIVDIEETMVKDNLVKVVGWYDNEWSYSVRLAEFADFVGTRLP